MPKPTDPLDQLIVKAADHDRPAMESLLLHFYDPLLSFVRKLVVVGSGIAPEDVVQMTMTEAFQRVWSLEPRGGRGFFCLAEDDRSNPAG